EVHSLGFNQLIMGFHWLVRNGTVQVPAGMYPKKGVFYNQSRDLPPILGGEIAPRTVIGTTATGELLIFQADGIESVKKGLTLEQAAIWSKEIGGYNVLNLDGGGSSTTMYKGKIVNRPTCQDTPTPLCERPVTTITCVI